LPWMMALSHCHYLLGPYVPSDDFQEAETGVELSGLPVVVRCVTRLRKFPPAVPRTFRAQSNANRLTFSSS
jgi:hypothetical protein